MDRLDLRMDRREWVEARDQMMRVADDQWLAGPHEKKLPLLPEWRLKEALIQCDVFPTKIPATDPKVHSGDGARGDPGVTSVDHRGPDRISYHFIGHQS